MRYVFYINPTAGKGNLQDGIISSIEDYFKDKETEYKIHITKSAGDAKLSAESEAETGDKLRIFACGGEGTVFEVLNGVVGYDNVELGVIPCGSANDFLKFFYFKNEFFDISAQVDGNSVEMDLIKAGDYYCLNGCSVGMDAVVARDMNIFKRWPLVTGSFAYTLAIVKTFLSKKLGITANISVDGSKPELTDCLFAVIANAPYYGGGYKGAPNAVPYDNKLDFTLVNCIPRLKIPKFLSLYKNGEHKILDYCTLKNCTSMEFSASKPIPVNLDGEIIEVTDMKFELVKKGVKFIVPTHVKNKMLTNL